MLFCFPINLLTMRAMEKIGNSGVFSAFLRKPAGFSIVSIAFVKAFGVTT